MSKGLTEKDLESIAKAVVKEQNKQKKGKPGEKKPKKDWRLRNTKTLLKNYRWLVKHISVMLEELDDYEDIVFDPEDLNLKALMKYKAKTKRMLDYFDSTWGSYKDYCKNVGGAMQRRCEVLEKLYLLQEPMKKIEVAEIFNVDERTIRRDETKATEELAIFLFGIDSLNDIEKLVV